MQITYASTVHRYLVDIKIKSKINCYPHTYVLFVNTKIKTDAIRPYLNLTHYHIWKVKKVGREN